MKNKDHIFFTNNTSFHNAMIFSAYLDQGLLQSIHGKGLNLH